jgi:hypothetical protein
VVRDADHGRGEFAGVGRADGGEGGFAEQPLGVAAFTDGVDEGVANAESVEQRFAIADNDIGCAVPWPYGGHEGAPIPRRRFVVRCAHDR